MDSGSHVDPSKTRVLVTGASGYLAIHCVQQLLNDGYIVRGTVRNLKNEKKVQPLRSLPHSEKLELVEADLDNSDSWIAAVKDCDYVLHTASPFPIVADESVVETAVNGTLRVLKACAKEFSVKKVVLTSSCAAINEGHDDENRIFDEKDWTIEDSPKVLPYPRSKAAAERSAWEFVKNLGDADNKFALTCINPVLIVGPLLNPADDSTSVTIIRRFLNNEMPAVPALNLALVDVRDVAKAHILAMTNKSSDGERILVTAQPSFWFRDISKTLAKEFRQQGYWLPWLQAPYFVLYIYSIFDDQAKAILDRVNRQVNFDSSKAKKLLGLEFRNPEDSLIDMAYSMIEQGILPKKFGYKERSH